MIELPAGFTTAVATSTSEFISELSPLAILVIGVLLGAVVIEILIHAIRHRS